MKKRPPPPSIPNQPVDPEPLEKSDKPDSAESELVSVLKSINNNIGIISIFMFFITLQLMCGKR